MKLRPPPLPGWEWTVTVWPLGTQRPRVGADQAGPRPRIFGGEEPEQPCRRAAELLKNPSTGDAIGGEQ